MNPTITREQVEHEARAKIFWGDDPDAVVHYLLINRFSPDEAGAFVDSVLRERMATVRKLGVRKILLGIAMLAVPVVAVWLFGWWYKSLMVLTILGAAGAVGLWGAWKILEGLLMLVFPENEKGDLADASN